MVGMFPTVKPKMSGLGVRAFSKLSGPLPALLPLSELFGIDRHHQGSAFAAQDNSFRFNERDHHGHGIDRRGDETISFVEAPGRIRNRMDEQRPDTSDLTGLHCAQHGILQQSRANSLPLKSFINGQSSKDHDRDRVRHIPFDAAWDLFMSSGPHGEAIVASDSFSGTDDVGPRSSTALILCSAAAQPLVQDHFAGIEGREIMRC